MERLHGWTGRLLHVDLGSGEAAITQSTDYVSDFIGGRLLGARLYWDDMSCNTGALDRGNVLMLLPGPLAGTPATACSRWVMVAKSPLLYPEQYGFGNGGGFLGAAVKQAGYDALIIRSSAQAPSYIFIENDRVEIRSARGLWGLSTEEALKKIRQQHGSSARAVCIGPAGEALVRFAVARTDQGGSLSNGMGAVMGSKNLKAIVVRGSSRVDVAYPDELKNINKRARFLRKGLNESVYMTEPMIQGIEYRRAAPCYGCPAGCMRAFFKHVSGREEVRKTCASTYFYTPWDEPCHGKATGVPFLATSLCDRFGLCTGEMSNVIHWLEDCFAKGLLDEEETGLPLTKIGSLEFITALAHLIVSKKNVGEVLAQGTRRAALSRGPEAEEIAARRVTSSGYINDAYGARVFLTTGLFYATEPRNPIIQLHEVNFLLLKWALWHTTSGAMSPITTDDLRAIAQRAWGGERAVDFSSYEGKAQAACIIQNRAHAKESMVACDRFFPLLDTDQEEAHMGDPTFVPRFFHAVTGSTLGEDDYYRLGARSVNLQRAIMAREGRSGRDSDSLCAFNFREPLETSEGIFGLFNPDLELPGPGSLIISRKGKTVEPEAFERMKDEYYRLRQWDPGTGLQKASGLENLGLGFVCGDLHKRGLLKQE